MRSAIITLNWQGLDDTTEFLDSLAPQLGPDDRLYLLDNASGDVCTSGIETWLSQHADGQYAVMTAEDFSLHGRADTGARYNFIKSSENMGFAVANNFVFDVIKNAGFDYITLINNDTVLGEDMLDNLFGVMARHPEYGAVTGNIRCYGEPDRLWNAGGRFTFYGDKVYFSRRRVERARAKGADAMDCEFITGCLLCARTDILRSHGLFTDKFFFGEDDFNFSMRMKEAGVKLGCALGAVLYHKISSSVSKISDSDDYRNIVHFTNRIIDQKEFMSPARWRVFRPFYLAVVLVKMIKNRYGIKTSLRVTGAVRFYSKKYDRVDRAVFMEICERYRQ